jgi:hypothetical protein
MCTPALPKPTPAIVAASAMLLRASTSEPSATARRRFAPMSSIAFTHRRSASGCAPW